MEQVSEERSENPGSSIEQFADSAGLDGPHCSDRVARDVEFALTLVRRPMRKETPLLKFGAWGRKSAEPSPERTDC